jgi:hypothetical protein
MVSRRHLRLSAGFLRGAQGRMGGTGVPPVPLGILPSGIRALAVISRVPFGETPTGTGGTPVPPIQNFASARLSHE